MQDKLVPQQFMLLDKKLRDKLAADFKLIKNGITEIIDQTVVRDGHTIDDLAAINLESMARYTSSTETSFGKLWELTVEKANKELNPSEEEKSTHSEPVTTIQEGSILTNIKNAITKNKEANS